jgi:hypothetical protein
VLGRGLHGARAHADAARVLTYVDELAAVLVHEAAEAPVGLEALNLFPQLVDLVRRRDDVLQRGVDRLGALRGVHVEREVLPRKARSPLLAPLAQRHQPLECELARLLVAARGRPRESREVGKFRLCEGGGGARVAGSA